MVVYLWSLIKVQLIFMSVQIHIQQNLQEWAEWIEGMNEQNIPEDSWMSDMKP